MFGKLGLELRKKTKNNVFDDVDAILANYRIKSGEINFNVQSQTVAHSLQNMLKSERYFSVCTIDRCAELCNIRISSERQAVYNAAHCVSWNDMLPDYRTMLTAMILDDFRTVLNPN